MNMAPPRPVAKQAPVHAPNAALLIDFDNVTMGIRSDLQHELRRLMNSEIIRGKVAVQRAYADWRRYPQYIVPLSEASIDLIFAPAFGSNKKNATDIRLAIDAIELVFTRPEIGTIILLSGDSDFSSLVIKLKEYGKYIIGVGIRESSSDLLIQNCDEYYSYNELAGLTRVGDQVTEHRDPWELVVDAVLEMKKRGDVMRSDRLKQVMQEIDPSFDEKNVGMSRFSKFIDESRKKGLIRATKLENGQYEIDLGPAAPGGEKALAPIPGEAEDRQSRERAERDAEDRGGRGRSRERGRGGRGRSRERVEAVAPAAAVSGEAMSLAEGFELLKRAVAEMGGVDGQRVEEDPLRDRMRTMHGRDDEILTHRPRFGRFLRQAHDAAIVDVVKGKGGYALTLKVPVEAPVAESVAEVPAKRGRGRGRGRGAQAAAAPAESPPKADAAPAAAKPAVASPAGRSMSRFRRGSGSGGAMPAQIPLVGVVELDEPVAAPAPKGRAKKPAVAKKAAGPRARKPKSEKKPKA